MEQVRMMRCGLCNANAEVKHMKYHKSGEYLICKNCHDKQNPGAKLVVEKPSVTMKEVSEVAQKKSDKVSYRCKNCGYSFSRARDHAFDLCPYCGKKAVSAMPQGAAQSILENTF